VKNTEERFVVLNRIARSVMRKHEVCIRCTFLFDGVRTGSRCLLRK